MIVEKPEGVFRILLIGDSFIEGEGVELPQTAAQVLEAELTETTGKPVEVVNMGVMSYSPIIYQRIIEDRGLPLDPDLVIVAVDISDFQNDYAYAKDLDENGNFRNILFQQKMGEPHVALPGVSAGAKFWLRTHSVLYNEAADRMKQLVRKINHIPEPTVFKINDPASDPHFATRSEDNALRPEMWEELGSSLIKIDRLLKRAGVPWMAVIYPYGHQSAPDEWGRGRLRNGFKAGKIYPATAAEELVGFGRKNGGFGVVNLVEGFRRAAATIEEPLFYPDDGHFTPLGHRVFAEAVKEEVDDYITYDR
jgi:lysophospholipase L1-like esterase